jgi:mono/diheme cytochrome c family protein
MRRLLPLLTLLLSQPLSAHADEVLFEKHVRPILKTHCFQCHGADGEKEGGLDLRLRRFIVDGGESGAAVVAGKPRESLLLKRVRTGEMPPGDDKRLSGKDVQLLEQWIQSGARTAREEPTDPGDGPIFTEEERGYWAFQLIQRPAVPEPRQTTRVRTPIDAFVLARQSGLADDADRERLIRRAYFDLTGLPPSPEAIDAFVNDNHTDAWARLIDELLESPHYGERWGRHWLDVAGYADSEGYTDEDRIRSHAWRYRDYVIRSFNADKPFDVFVQEQLAGDEMVPLPHRNLSPEAIEKLTATGFLRMAPDGTASSGIDKAAAQNQVIADTLQIVGTSLLGLTINCAQCHDHRYDPIPTSDYYRLRAIFEPAFDWKNWRTPAGRQVSLYTDADREQAKDVEAEAVVVDQLRQHKAEEYITRTLEEELLLVPEGTRDALRTAYRTTGKDRDEQQQAVLKEYPSVASISVGSLYLYDRRRAERAAKIDALRNEKEKRFIAAATMRALNGVLAAERAAVVSALKVSTAKRTPQQAELLQKYPGVLITKATLSEFAPESAAELQRDADEAQALRNSKAADDLKRYAEKAAKIRGRKPVEGFVRMLAEVPGKVPATFVFYRGDHEQPKTEVKPGDLSILAEAATISENDESLPTSGRRLAFAKYVTSHRHPLFARVIVNRIWLHHFGRGLVNSPGDFGALGSRPTHPALLDWLAAEFISCGFRVKHIHRLIMRSTVYRQASGSGTTTGKESQYVGFRVRRLESETIRDAVLAVCGLLNPKQFGEPVPVMEDAVGQIVIGKENLDGERKPTKTVALDGEEYRRSVYIQVRRTRTLSIFETFDAATLSPNCDQRSFSTTTPQSLLMMNSDFAVTYAEAFAKRVRKDAGKNDADTVTRAWRLAFGTRPTHDDVQQALEFLSGLKDQLREQNPKLKDGDVDQNAFAVFCQALLSSNRFLYVE